MALAVALPPAPWGLSKGCVFRKPPDKGGSEVPALAGSQRSPEHSWSFCLFVRLRDSTLVSHCSQAVQVPWTDKIASCSRDPWAFASKMQLPVDALGRASTRVQGFFLFGMRPVSSYRVGTKPASA